MLTETGPWLRPLSAWWTQTQILYFQASSSLCLLKQCKIIFCSMLTEEWSLTEALAKCQPSPLQMPQWLINQCFLSLSCLLNYEFKYFQVFSPCMYFTEKTSFNLFASLKNWGASRKNTRLAGFWQAWSSSTPGCQHLESFLQAPLFAQSFIMGWGEPSW